MDRPVFAAEHPAFPIVKGSAIADAGSLLYVRFRAVLAGVRRYQECTEVFGVAGADRVNELLGIDVAERVGIDIVRPADADLHRDMRQQRQIFAKLCFAVTD